MALVIQTSNEYLTALDQAKQLITTAQGDFLKSANRTSMEMKLALGKLIAENSTRYDWGKSILETFSSDLISLFPDSRGFSVSNLGYMRQFYHEYKDKPSHLDLAKNIRWGTNIVIMKKVKDLDARLFYLKMAADTVCSRNVIIAQISSKAYEREFYQDKKHNFNNALPEAVAAKAENLLKSSYFFETTDALGLAGPLKERHVEEQMVNRIKEVIMMLGKGFAFIGSQYPLHADDNSYRLDLLFSNRIIQALVAVELKISRFKAEYAGKMNLYLSMLDEMVKLPHENPSIGLILCTDRNDVEVDYVLPSINRPIGVAELKLAKVLPDNLVGKLPDPDELRKKILQNLDEKQF